jgi:hypothetical protein
MDAAPAEGRRSAPARAARPDPRRIRRGRCRTLFPRYPCAASSPGIDHRTARSRARHALSPGPWCAWASAGSTGCHPTLTDAMNPRSRASSYGPGTDSPATPVRAGLSPTAADATCGCSIPVGHPSRRSPRCVDGDFVREGLPQRVVDRQHAAELCESSSTQHQARSLPPYCRGKHADLGLCCPTLGGRGAIQRVCRFHHLDHAGPVTSVPSRRDTVSSV